MGWTPRQWACAARLAGATEEDSRGLPLARLRDKFDRPESDNPDWTFVEHMKNGMRGLYLP